jgi:hypothetical protein
MQPKDIKLPYFPEYSTDFIGTQSPSLHIYNPNDMPTKTAFPEASVTKGKRFIGESIEDQLMRQQV